MPGRRATSRETLRRRDGALCVSFANTCSDRRRAPRDYAELLAWLVRHGAVEPADAERLAAMAAEHPGEAAAVFTFAESARELLRRVFDELADHRKLSPELVDEVNSELVAALPRQRIVPAKTGFTWDWAFGSAEDLGQTLWPVIESAAKVLTSKYFAKVVRCGGEGCDLLFVRRRGGSPRRWCSMESCGKRVKSQRYYLSNIGTACESPSGPDRKALSGSGAAPTARLGGWISSPTASATTGSSPTGSGPPTSSREQTQRTDAQQVHSFCLQEQLPGAVEISDGQIAPTAGADEKSEMTDIVCHDVGSLRDRLRSQNDVAVQAKNT